MAEGGGGGERGKCMKILFTREYVRKGNIRWGKKWCFLKNAGYFIKKRHFCFKMFDINAFLK